MDRMLRVDSDRLDGLTAQMDGAIDERDEILDQLEARVQNLRGRWDGDAARAYESAHRDWDESIRSLHAIAREVARITKSGSSSFRAMETANAAVWRV